MKKRRYRSASDTVPDTQKNRAIKCCFKFDAQWVNTPIHKLWLQVLCFAVHDLLKHPAHIDHMQAVQWLNSDLDELQLCNIEPAWIRRVLIKAELLQPVTLTNMMVATMNKNKMEVT